MRDRPIWAHSLGLGNRTFAAACPAKELTTYLTGLSPPFAYRELSPLIVSAPATQELRLPLGATVRERNHIQFGAPSPDCVRCRSCQRGERPCTYGP